MTFSIVEIMRRLLASKHKISCSRFFWWRLIVGLRARGEFVRESGAFLLGYRREDGGIRITDFVLYDDLDPDCLSEGCINFDGGCLGKLWDYCRSRDLTVVADIHTHPGGAQQSSVDRAHPMINQSGHIAFILPRFAATSLWRRDFCVYRYDGVDATGKKCWRALPKRGFLHIGF